MYIEIVSKRLRDERHRKCYTQKQVAGFIGIDVNVIVKIENGTRKPDVEVVGKLADLFGVRVDWLYGKGQRMPGDMFDRMIG